jgi:hypothetical protein
MKLSPEARAKISEAMKRSHAERKKSGSKQKKAGLAKDSLVRQLEAELEREISERQTLLNLLRRRTT